MEGRARHKSSQPKRTVLFLGAGASAAFGYPVTRAIFPQILLGLGARTLFPIASNPKRERAKMRRLQGYVTQMLPLAFEANMDLPLITDLLSLIDLLLTTGDVAIPKMTATELQDFRTLLEQAILEVIEGQDPRRSQGKRLDKFADWILNTVDAQRAPLTIVSTNYDTLIDSLLFQRITADPQLNLEDVIDMGFSWREHSTGTFNDVVHQPPPSPRVRLYKLHGSLNWLRCPLCGFVYINTVGSIHQQAFREDKVDYNNTCVCGHGPVSAVIVAPSMVRSVHNPDLLTIWRNALEAMRTADEWIIAGYSLPPEDIAIRSILVRSYHGRRRSVAPKIRVIQLDPDKTLEDRYRLVLPGCHFEYGGVEAFIESLPKPLKHYPVF